MFMPKGNIYLVHSSPRLRDDCRRGQKECKRWRLTTEHTVSGNNRIAAYLNLQQGQAKPNLGTEKGHTITPLAMEYWPLLTSHSSLCVKRKREMERERVIFL